MLRSVFASTIAVAALIPFGATASAQRLTTTANTLAWGTGQERVAKPAPLARVSRDGVRPLLRVGRIWLAGQPSEHALEELVAEGVREVIDLRTAREDRGFAEAERTAALGARYVSLPFGGPVPLTDALIDSVRRELGQFRGEGEGQVLLHCAGAYRVAGVWLAYRVLDEGVPYEVALEEARQVGLPKNSLETKVRHYILGAGIQALGEWKEKIRAEFPSVRAISVDALAERLMPRSEGEADRPPPPLLIDVRTGPEYRVSHIRGAQSAPDEGALHALLAETPKDREIVLYCSIGYRSAKAVKALQARGFTNVRNLEGSIFEWANTGHPVVRGDRVVREVHPFDEEWGKLLHRDLWADAAKK